MNSATNGLTEFKQDLPFPSYTFPMLTLKDCRRFYAEEI
jgi:hypothetical protein